MDRAVIVGSSMKSPYRFKVSDFARRGEMASNRREDHESSMLSLHLIQNCMVYINTLMIQKVLARPRWQQAMTPRDYAALTPLIWSHVNPLRTF